VVLIIWAIRPSLQSRTSVAAAALSFIAISILAVLSTFEHSRSIRPSSVINVYIFLSTILDLAQARTLWLLSANRSLAVVFTTCIAFNIILLILESIEKKEFLKTPFCNYPPESLGGIFNRTVFWWLNDLFLKGYRCILKFDDLYETDDELTAKALQQRVRSEWQRSNKENRHCLFLAIMSSFKFPLAKMIIPRLCQSAFKLCQPLLINRVVSLLSEPRTKESRQIGYGLTGATALVYFGLSVFNARSKHMIYRAVVMIRGGLISLISDATLLLDADVAKEAAAVTLMSTDVDRIVAGLENSDFIWAAPIEIAVALYLLNREIGLPCLVPLAISLGKHPAKQM
jgi:ATP-binding cassette subfamily C (CFTR/MRP) protein 1